MAETAAGQNTEENNTVPPLLWDSQGKAGVAPLPCLSPVAKKELIEGQEYLLSVTRLEGSKMGGGGGAAFLVLEL